MDMDSKARRVARSNGYVLRKSRRAISHQNAGAFMIVDPTTNFAVDGFTYNMDAADVLAFFDAPLQTG
jgi:hypothetical protein